MSKIYDTIIIGSGPAGMTAAIYLKRASKDVLILERESCGGQMAMAPLIENFPSIDSISGSELADRMMNQILNLGVDFELEEALKIEKDNDIFHITTDYNSYEAKSVIVASGAMHKKLGASGEEKLLGKGISYCVSCDGAFYKGEEVAVIGDANSALQYALELSSYCPKVHLCMLFDRFFAESVLVDRVAKKDNIIVYRNLLLKSFIGDDKLNSLLFTNTKTNEDFKLDVPGVFIAIGQEPKNDIIKSLAEINKAGYVLSDSDMKTKTPGLFVAGDTRDKSVRQCATAISDGAVAATSAIKYLG